MAAFKGLGITKARMMVTEATSVSIGSTTYSIAQIVENPSILFKGDVDTIRFVLSHADSAGKALTGPARNQAVADQKRRIAIDQQVTDIAEQNHIADLQRQAAEDLALQQAENAAQEKLRVLNKEREAALNALPTVFAALVDDLTNPSASVNWAMEIGGDMRTFGEALIQTPGQLISNFINREQLRMSLEREAEERAREQAAVEQKRRVAIDQLVTEIAEKSRADHVKDSAIAAVVPALEIWSAWQEGQDVIADARSMMDEGDQLLSATGLALYYANKSATLPQSVLEARMLELLRLRQRQQARDEAAASIEQLNSPESRRAWKSAHMPGLIISYLQELAAQEGRLQAKIADFMLFVTHRDGPVVQAYLNGATKGEIRTLLRHGLKDVGIRQNDLVALRGMMVSSFTNQLYQSIDQWFGDLRQNPTAGSGVIPSRTSAIMGAVLPRETALFIVQSYEHYLADRVAVNDLLKSAIIERSEALGALGRSRIADLQRQAAEDLALQQADNAAQEKLRLLREKAQIEQGAAQQAQDQSATDQTRKTVITESAEEGREFDRLESLRDQATRDRALQIQDLAIQDRLRMLRDRAMKDERARLSLVLALVKLPQNLRLEMAIIEAQIVRSTDIMRLVLGGSLSEGDLRTYISDILSAHKITNEVLMFSGTGMNKETLLGDLVALAQVVHSQDFVTGNARKMTKEEYAAAQQARLFAQADALLIQSGWVQDDLHMWNEIRRGFEVASFRDTAADEAANTRQYGFVMDAVESAAQRRRWSERVIGGADAVAEQLFGIPEFVSRQLIPATVDAAVPVAAAFEAAKDITRLREAQARDRLVYEIVMLERAREIRAHLNQVVRGLASDAAFLEAVSRDETLAKNIIVQALNREQIGPLGFLLVGISQNQWAEIVVGAYHSVLSARTDIESSGSQIDHIVLRGRIVTAITNEFVVTRQIMRSIDGSPALQTFLSATIASIADEQMAILSQQETNIIDALRREVFEQSLAGSSISKFPSLYRALQARDLFRPVGAFSTLFLKARAKAMYQLHLNEWTKMITAARSWYEMQSIETIETILNTESVSDTDGVERVFVELQSVIPGADEVLLRAAANGIVRRMRTQFAQAVTERNKKAQEQEFAAILAEKSRELTFDSVLMNNMYAFITADESNQSLAGQKRNALRERIRALLTEQVSEVAGLDVSVRNRYIQGEVTALVRRLESVSVLIPVLEMESSRTDGLRPFIAYMRDVPMEEVLRVSDAFAAMLTKLSVPGDVDAEQIGVLLRRGDLAGAEAYARDVLASSSLFEGVLRFDPASKLLRPYAYDLESAAGKYAVTVIRSQITQKDVQAETRRMRAIAKRMKAYGEVPPVSGWKYGEKRSALSDWFGIRDLFKARGRSSRSDESLNVAMNRAEFYMNTANTIRLVRETRKTITVHIGNADYTLRKPSGFWFFRRVESVRIDRLHEAPFTLRLESVGRKTVTVSVELDADKTTLTSEFRRDPAIRTIGYKIWRSAPWVVSSSALLSIAAPFVMLWYNVMAAPIPTMTYREPPAITQSYQTDTSPGEIGVAKPSSTVPPITATDKATEAPTSQPTETKSPEQIAYEAQLEKDYEDALSADNPFVAYFTKGMYRYAVLQRKAQAEKEGKQYWLRLLGTETPTQEQMDAIINDPVISIMILGMDSRLGAGSENPEKVSIDVTKNDQNVMVFINSQTGQVRVMTLARKFIMADGSMINEITTRPLPRDASKISYDDKYFYPLISDANKTSPIESVKFRFEWMTGQPVDSVNLFGFNGFKTAIDTIFPDGIKITSIATVNNATDLPDGSVKPATRIIFEEGKTYKMNGEKLLMYVRLRHGVGALGDSSWGRTVRLGHAFYAIAQELSARTLSNGNIEDTLRIIQEAMLASESEQSMMTDTPWIGQGGDINQGIIAEMIYRDQYLRTQKRTDYATTMAVFPVATLETIKGFDFVPDEYNSTQIGNPIIDSFFTNYRILRGPGYLPTWRGSQVGEFTYRPGDAINVLRYYQPVRDVVKEQLDSMQGASVREDSSSGFIPQDSGATTGVDVSSSWLGTVADFWNTQADDISTNNVAAKNEQSLVVEGVSVSDPRRILNEDGAPVVGPTKDVSAVPAFLDIWLQEFWKIDGLIKRDILTMARRLFDQMEITKWMGVAQVQSVKPVHPVDRQQPVAVVKALTGPARNNPNGCSSCRAELVVFQKMLEKILATPDTDEAVRLLNLAKSYFSRYIMVNEDFQKGIGAELEVTEARLIRNRAEQQDAIEALDEVIALMQSRTNVPETIQSDWDYAIEYLKAQRLNVSGMEVTPSTPADWVRMRLDNAYYRAKALAGTYVPVGGNRNGNNTLVQLGIIRPMPETLLQQQLRDMAPGMVAEARTLQPELETYNMDAFIDFTLRFTEQTAEYQELMSGRSPDEQGHTRTLLHALLTDTVFQTVSDPSGPITMIQQVNQEQQSLRNAGSGEIQDRLVSLDISAENLVSDLILRKLGLPDEGRHAILGILAKVPDVMEFLTRRLFESSFSTVRSDELTEDQIHPDARAIAGTIYAPINASRKQVIRVWSSIAYSIFKALGYPVAARMDLKNLRGANEAAGQGGYTGLGDDMLRLFTQQVVNALGDGYELVRVGGDEFMVFAKPGMDTSRVEQTIADALKTTHMLYKVAGTYVNDQVAVEFKDHELPIEERLNDGGDWVTAMFGTSYSKETIDSGAAYHPLLAYVSSTLQSQPPPISEYKVFPLHRILNMPFVTRLNKQQYEAVMLSVRRIMAVLLFDDVLRDKASELQTAFRKTNPNATVAVYEVPQDWMEAVRVKFPRGFKVLRFDFPGILKFINTVSNAWGDRMIVDQFAKLANYAFAKMGLTDIFVYRRANELYLAVDPAKHIDIKAAKSSLGGYFNAGGKMFKELAVLSEAEITDLVPEGADGKGTAANMKKLSAMFGTLAGGIVERTNEEIFAEYLAPFWKRVWNWITKSQAQKLADRDYLINYENPFDKRGIDRITGIGATEEEIAGLKKFYREVSPGSGEVTDAGGAYAALIRILTRIRDTQTRGPGQTGSWWQPFSDHQTSARVMPNQPIFSTIVNTFFSWKEHSLAPFSNTNIPPGIPGEDAQVPNDESLLVAYANASDVVVPTLEPLNGTEVNDAAVVQRIERTLKAIRSSAKLTSDVWNDERIKIAAQGLVLYRMIYAEGSKNLQHLLAHQEVLQGFIGVRPIKSLGNISESGGAIRGGFSNVQNIDDALVELQTLIKKYGDGFMSVERINYSGVSYAEGVSIELMNHRAIEWNVQKYNAYFEGIRPADSVVWLVQHPEKWPGVPYFNGEQSYFNEFRYGILSGFPPAAVDRHAWNNARPTDFIASIIDIYKLFRGGWHMVKVGTEYPEMRAPGIVNVLDRIGYGFVPYTLADVHWIREIGVLEAVTQAFLNLTQEERVSAETLPQGERTDGFLGINSDCFSMNPFLKRVYAADGQQGNTCHPFFRAPMKVIREWWGDQQVLHVIDPTVVKLLKLSVAPAVDRVYIGSQRHATNAFVVPGEQLSHQFAPDHAIVSVTNDGLVLQNLSSWGTWVNGTPVEVNVSQRMLYGDEIVFGQDPQDPEEHQLWRYQVDMDADGRVVLRRASPVDALGAAAISLPVWFPAGAMENAGQHTALLRPSDTFRLAAIGGIPTHTDERIVIAYTSAGGNRSSLEIKPTTSVRGIIDNLPRQVTSFRIYRGKTKQYRQVGVLDVRPDGWVSVRGIAGNAAFAAETQVPDPAEAAGNRTLNWLQNARFDAAGQLIMAAVQKARDDGCFSANPFMTRVYAADGKGTTCAPFVMSRNRATREFRDNEKFREQVTETVTKRFGIQFVASGKKVGSGGCRFPACIRVDRALFYMAMYQLLSGDLNTRWIAVMGKAFVDEHIADACKPPVYFAFHDIEKGRIRFQAAWGVIKALFAKDSRDRDFQCEELTEDGMDDSAYAFNADAVVWDVRTVNGNIEYFTDDPRIVEYLHLSKNGVIQPAIIVQPIARGAVANLSDWNSIVQAYERLGKRFSDPIYIQFLGEDIDEAPIYKLNGIPQADFASAIYDRVHTPWIVEQDGKLAYLVTPNAQISEYNTAIRVLWPYDTHESLLDYSYKGNNYLIGAIRALSIRDPSIPVEEQDRYYPTYMSMVSKDANDTPVNVLVAPGMLWSQALQENFTHELNTQGIDHELGIMDPIDGGMLTTRFGFDQYQVNPAVMDQEAWRQTIQALQSDNGGFNSFKSSYVLIH